MVSKEFKSFNLDELLKNKEVKIISTKEALKDITPVSWSKEILEKKEFQINKVCANHL